MLPWKGAFWYRRSFFVPPAVGGISAALEFDGVMARPQVYVNGHLAGGWDYGYSSFRVDATPFITFGATNTVAVRCDTTHQYSRWYPGAGIYRDVRLVLLPPVHLVPDSTFIVTPFVSSTSALVTVSTAITNTMAAAVDFDLDSTITASSGIRVVSRHSRATLPAHSAIAITNSFPISSPVLWSPDFPALYALVLSCGPGGQREGNTRSLKFGIRSFVFTPDDGLHLNGRRVQLQGVNLHSDLGPLGMAFNESAARRQLLLMKSMGVNAIRTSHNPPAPRFLDLCDELGFVVWDECFDKWNATAGRHPSENLEAYVSRNLRALVLRDRNHPSVFVWSIYNEIPGLVSDGRKDDVSRERCVLFRSVIRELDTTRPVGCGNIGRFSSRIATGVLDDLDITGWNYEGLYAPVHAYNPSKPVVYSESASAFSSAGFYQLPPPAYPRDYAGSVFECDGYDLTCGPDIADVEFARMEHDRYCAGEFVWTGIDYLGEPSPYRKRGACSSYFGICDLTGIPKDRYFLYRSYWNTNAVTCHILPHWNWPGREGWPIPVYVYTSGNRAELFLNGRSLGFRVKSSKLPVYPCGPSTAVEIAPAPGGKSAAAAVAAYYSVCDHYRLRWQSVPYEPGELKAVCYNNDQVIGTATVHTASAPAALRLALDPFSPVGCDPSSLVFVQVSAADASGIPCPLATNRVSFSVSGPVEIVAVGNGDARELTSFASNAYPLYAGRALVILRRLAVSAPGADRQPIILTATTPDLKSSTLEL